jgi:hypothetical protein
MRRAAATAIAALLGVACGPDSVPFQISLRLDDNCEVSRCEQVLTACDAAIGFRIVDASSGDLYVNECVPVEGGQTLCQLIERLDLDPEILPNAMVRIEIAIWPYDEEDPPDDACPEIEYTAFGTYKSGDPAPAIAGLSYFEVGSSSLAPVTLGCVEKEELDRAECKTDVPHVEVTLIDFEDRIPVEASLAERLTVSIGEPRANIIPDQWVLRAADLLELVVTMTLPVLTYEIDLPFNFQRTACIQVLSDDLGSAATIRCYLASPADLDGNLLQVEGTLLDESTFDAIQKAVGGGDSGLVIGLVLGNDGNPAAGATVSPRFGEVQYLSADLTSTAGLTETSSSGVFASLEAPYDVAGEINFWNANRGDNEATTGVAIGGIVNDKVTIVILRLATVPTP